MIVKTFVGVAMTLFLASATCVLPLRGAEPAKSCADLKKERQEEFSYHLRTVNQIRVSRQALDDMNTTDPATINARFNTFSSSVKNFREKYQRLTPDEERLFRRTMLAFEDALAFWQSKKANLETGGAVDVTGGNRYRAYIEANLARLESSEQLEAKSIDKFDAEIAACKTRASLPQPRHEAKPAPASRYHWAGTYVSGAYVITVSGGGGSIEYKADRDGPDTTDHVTGKCTVRGTEATCTEEGTYKDSDKTVQRKAKATLTLSGDTISSKSVVLADGYSVTRADGQPCPQPKDCTSLHPDAEFSGTWTRKP